MKSGEDRGGSPSVGTQWDQWLLEAEMPARSHDAVSRVFRGKGPRGTAALKIFDASASLAAAAEHAALSTLEHPAFPRLLGSGRAPWWLATEWVEGHGLDESMTSADAVSVLAQLLGALSHAHARGIIHGDLRPANVLVDERGKVSLVDLGLGGRLEVRSSRVSGTPAYLAPERLAGAAPNPAADLFSAGAMFVELLAGAEALAAIGSSRDDGRGPEPSWRAAHPAALTSLLRELIAREPHARPASAGEALERLLPLLPSPLPAPLAHLVSDGRLRPAAATADPAEPPLVGRDAALAQIETMVRATADGRGTFVVINSEAGLGRTRLLVEAAARAAAAGVRPLAGRCRHSAAERGPWREIILALIPDLRALSAAEIAELVTADVRALGSACPEILDLAHVRTLPDPPELSPDLEKFRVFSGATALLRAWSRRQPIVLLIDDVQWADDATVELIYYLQRNVVHGASTFGEAGAGGALSIVLARRHPSEHESSLLERTLASAQRGGTSLEIALPRLGPDHVRDLVAGMLAGSPVPREFSDLVAAESGGSPQVAVELVRTLHAEGLVHRVKGEWRFAGAHGSASGQLADVLRRRLDRVDAEPRQLLIAAAIIGQEFDLSVAAEAAGLTEEAAEPAARQLQGARLILRPGQSSPRCAFVHEQLRRLVLDQLDANERAERHVAVARALARRGAGSAELARHHVAARDTAGALEHLPRAAAQARAAGNPIEALLFLTEQIELLEGLPREERLRHAKPLLAARQSFAEILQRLGRYDEAAAAWADLLAACRIAGDAAAESQALVGLGSTANLSGDYTEAREHLSRGLLIAEDRKLATVALAARIYLVQNAYMCGRFDEGEPQVAAVRAALATQRDRGLTAEALRQIGLFHHFRGRSDEAIPLYKEALQLLAVTGDRGTTAKTLHNLGILHNARGEHDVAMDCYERSLAIFRELGLRIEQAKCLSNIGNIRLQQGSPTEAERCYLQAQSIYRDLGDRRSEAENLSNLGEVDARRANWREARERHEQALAVHRDLGNPAGIAYGCYELAVTQLALGRLDVARPLVAEALERDRELGNPRGLAYDLAASALLHQLSGDDEQSLREYGLALAEARRAGDRYHAALLLGDLAWQLITMRRPKDAQVHAAQAHLEATSLGAHEAEAVALLAQARAAGPSAGRERLERALDLAQRTENPEVQWRAWQSAALLASDRPGRAVGAMDRAVNLVGDVARRLGDEAPSFLSRRDVRRVLDDSLDLEEQGDPRAEAILSRYHLLATDEQRGRAKQLLARTLGDSPADSRELRRLRTFHDVVTTQDVLSLDTLLEAFTLRLVAAAEADRGFVYLLRDRELTCRVAIARGGRPLAAPEREVPRQVLEWVVRERASLVSEDVAADARITWRDSVADLRVRSLLAAPLLAPLPAPRAEHEAASDAGPGAGPREVWGVVYVDRRVTGASFANAVREDFEAACDDLARLIGIAHRAEARVDQAKRVLEDAPASGLPGLVGISPPMQRLFATARVAAASSASVLITGESGTGKEGLARALHRLSPRSSGPFVAIDCGSIPASLIESVLFGHVRGAFTGADRDRAGLFEEADKGTLFLDEITNASIDVQARLLRVLQEREVRRVGGRGTIPVDVRIVAATNVDLEKEVAAGHFRQDLFYRLDVIHLALPRLADRPEDVPILAEHFLRQIVAAEKKPIDGFTEEALRVLQSHAWPGNVRELGNCVARMAAFATEGRLGVDRIPESVRGAGAIAPSMRLAAEGAGAGHAGDAAARIVDSMASGQTNFWEAVRAPLRDRSLTRSLAQEIVAEGLRRSGGSYRAVVLLFGLGADDYGRFMDFLRFNKLKLDFREYRNKA